MNLVTVYRKNGYNVVLSVTQNLGSKLGCTGYVFSVYLSAVSVSPLTPSKTFKLNMFAFVSSKTQIDPSSESNGSVVRINLVKAPLNLD